MPTLTDYVAVPQKVRAHSHIEVPSRKARLKLYTLMPRDEHDLSDSALEVLAESIVNEISSKRIDPLEGLGFAIVSPEIVNVNFWGGNYPSLLHPNIYTFDNKDLDDAVVGIKKPSFELHRASVGQIGAYCCWEGVVVGHESRAWIDFLASSREEFDRERYLDNFFEGVIESRVS